METDRNSGEVKVAEPEKMKPARSLFLNSAKTKSKKGKKGKKRKGSGE
jgi:hypothetical protein